MFLIADLPGDPGRRGLDDQEERDSDRGKGKVAAGPGDRPRCRIAQHPADELEHDEIEHAEDQVQGQGEFHDPAQGQIAAHQRQHSEGRARRPAWPGRP